MENFYRRSYRDLSIVAVSVVTVIVTCFVALSWHHGQETAQLRESLQGRYEINADYARYMSNLGIQYPLPGAGGCSTDCGYGE